MTRQKRKWCSLPLWGAGLFLTACAAQAFDSTELTAAEEAAVSASDDRQPWHGPPPEAFAACESLAEGDACTVSIHEHTLEGSCLSPPDGDGPLACAPDGPPPEALAACAELALGDACTIALEDHILEGSCLPPPEGDGPLACVPPHHRSEPR